jgi:hypothetical protein
LAVEPVTLVGGSLSAGGYRVAHLTGTAKFTLDAAARKEITDFVDAGGTLVIDAAGGSPAFAEAAETELEAMFGDQATKGMARPLPADHALYLLPNAKVDRFGYRRFARKGVVGDLRGPRLKGIKTKAGDRVAVFYSREDLSAGLVGEPVDGIIGYDVPTATPIMRNILLYAAGAGNVAAKPAGKPAAKPTEVVPF